MKKARMWFWHDDEILINLFINTLLKTKLIFTSWWVKQKKNLVTNNFIAFCARHLWWESYRISQGRGKTFFSRYCSCRYNWKSWWQLIWKKFCKIHYNDFIITLNFLFVFLPMATVILSPLKLHLNNQQRVTVGRKEKSHPVIKFHACKIDEIFLLGKKSFIVKMDSMISWNEIFHIVKTFSILIYFLLFPFY